MWLRAVVNQEINLLGHSPDQPAVIYPGSSGGVNGDVVKIMPALQDAISRVGLVLIVGCTWSEGWGPNILVDHDMMQNNPWKGPFDQIRWIVFNTRDKKGLDLRIFLLSL